MTTAKLLGYSGELLTRRRRHGELYTHTKFGSGLYAQIALVCYAYVMITCPTPLSHPVNPWCPFLSWPRHLLTSRSGDREGQPQTWVTVPSELIFWLLFLFLTHCFILYFFVCFCILLYNNVVNTAARTYLSGTRYGNNLLNKGLLFSCGLCIPSILQF